MTTLVEQQLESGHTVRLTWSSDDPQAQPSRIEITGGPISSTVLRRVDFSAAAEERRAQLASTSTTRYRDRLADVARLRGVTPLYLACLAAAYVEEVESGNRAPTEALAEITGRARGTVTQQLKQVRREGYLTSHSHRAGGEITDQARHVLEEQTHRAAYKGRKI